jgi:hypothetical protein
MKKTITILMMMVLAACFTKAQDTLAGWTFPTGTAADANPNFSNILNTTMTITTQGGTSAIDFSKTGFTTKAAQATGWNGGANLKYWQIQINTSGYKDLKLNSMQQSGATNAGPRDYKVQYEIGASGTWTDIPGSNIITANNWTSSVLNNIDIPAACNNQSSVYIRWIMTSDTSSAPPALVISTGTSKIDNIIISGTSLSSSITEFQAGSFSIFPNPAKESVFVNCTLNSEFEIFSVDGKILKEGLVNNQQIDVSELNKGIYLFEIKNEKGVFIKKLIIQ